MLALHLTNNARPCRSTCFCLTTRLQSQICKRCILCKNVFDPPGDFLSQKILLHSAAGSLRQPRSRKGQLQRRAGCSEPFSVQIAPGVEMPHLSGYPVPRFGHSTVTQMLLLQKGSQPRRQSRFCTQRANQTLLEALLDKIAWRCEAHYETSAGVCCPLQPRDLSPRSAFR